MPSTRPTTARAERAALVDLLAQVGPDAPTLCGGWRTRDLAAHLVLRERRPDAALGIMVGPLGSWTRRVQRGLAGQDWDALLAQVRTGPPRWSPAALGPVDEAVNTVEFYVHHEDVRRGGEGWARRDLDARTAADLWSALTRSARFLLRRCPVGVVAVPTDGPGAGTETRLRGGDPLVSVGGPVGEIVLAVYGRATTDLELSGPVQAIEAFQTYPR